jgi:hypothetical protein
MYGLPQAIWLAQRSHLQRTVDFRKNCVKRILWSRFCILKNCCHVRFICSKGLESTKIYYYSFLIYGIQYSFFLFPRTINVN